MKEGKSWLTPKEVAELLSMTPRNVNLLINSGKIRASKDESGRYFIEKSEFFRTHPEAFRAQEERNQEKMSEKVSIKFLEEKIAHLKDMISEKKKENEFLTNQISVITNEKSKMLDTISSHARLLEYKETGGKGGHPPSKKKSKWWSFKK